MPLWHGYTKLSAEYVFAMSLAALMCPLLRYDDDNHDIATAEDAAMNIHNRHRLLRVGVRSESDMIKKLLTGYQREEPPMSGTSFVAVVFYNSIGLHNVIVGYCCISENTGLIIGSQRRDLANSCLCENFVYRLQ